MIIIALLYLVRPFQVVLVDAVEGMARAIVGVLS